MGSNMEKRPLTTIQNKYKIQNKAKKGRAKTFAFEKLEDRLCWKQ